MFFREINELDLGETPIDNIFIDIFMPMANGTYVKIYILGYRYASNPSNQNVTNRSLAKNLNIPLSDILSAWDFWEEKKLIKKHAKDTEDECDYSVEFLNIKTLYVENIVKPSTKHKTSPNELVDSYSNINVQKMFNDINEIIHRQLVPNEKMNILDIIDKYNVCPDMIKYAYSFAKEKKGVKSVKYVEAIIRNWNDDKIYTMEDLENHMIKKSERFAMYKLVFDELGFNRQPSVAEKKTIDIWIDTFSYDKKMILHACSKSKNISNVSIAYINAILSNWYDKGFKRVDDIVEEPKPRTQQKNSQYSKEPNYTTKFHNFKQRTDNYTAEELERIVLENQRRKFEQEGRK